MGNYIEDVAMDKRNQGVFILRELMTLKGR